ncbi:MAG: ATP-binding protein [Rhodoferax sp.]|nr:ATP-binding protein [Rhodoferax sp.]MDP3650992.1 ATP-binding protein [Rhodoferax sp.]
MQSTPTVDDLLLLNAKLVEERNMLQQVIDTIPNHIYVKDVDGRYLIANKNLLQAFGLEFPEQLIGKSDFDLFPAENCHHIRASELEVIQTGQPLNDHEESNSNLDGTQRWFSTSKVPLLDVHRSVTGIVGLSRDITLHKLHEQELERRNEELALLNAQLIAAREQLVQSEKLAALGRLVAGVAHKLNTPLGVGVTVASTLRFRTQELLQTIAQGVLTRTLLEQYLNEVNDGEEMLLRALGTASDLVTRFKQISVDQASNQRRCFSLQQVLEDVVGMLGPLYKNTPYTLNLDLAPDIELDSYPGPLSQVLTNLVSNALTHAFEGRSTGGMQLHTRRLGESLVELSFSDDGVGIPEADLPHVFDPFFTTRLGRGGVGLGMSMVYNVVTGILGGEVHLASQVDQGVQVSIRLPLSAPV